MSDQRSQQPEDEHAGFLRELLNGTSSEASEEARQHISGCDVCHRRLNRGVMLYVGAGIVPASAPKNKTEGIFWISYRAEERFVFGNLVVTIEIVKDRSWPRAGIFLSYKAPASWNGVRLSILTTEGKLLVQEEGLATHLGRAKANRIMKTIQGRVDALLSLPVCISLADELKLKGSN